MQASTWLMVLQAETHRQLLLVYWKTFLPIYILNLPSIIFNFQQHYTKLSNSVYSASKYSSTMIKNVCIIGAGPSGLVASRELKKEGHKVVVFEQNHDVGGQWLYESNIENEDPLGKGATFLNVHSSLYESLRVISPREIMGYSDFPFVVKKGRDTRRYPSHKELLLYLQDFCEYFELREMIRFNTRVEDVSMMNYDHDHDFGNKDLRWIVKSKEKNGYKVVEEVFDAVVVATGHYSHPKVPNIKGMDTWKRKQMHCHIYRSPQPFLNEVVVVVGSSFSGRDISMELLNVAKEIYISARSDISQGFSKVIAKNDNLHLRPQIKSLQEDGQVLFVDGSTIVADTIIYCTGYTYSFPFLDTKGIVGVDNDRVGPLFEHTFPPSLAPSLSFVGIPRRVIGFPFFELQAKWIAQLLSGKRTLPSSEDMMLSIKEFYDSIDVAGLPKHTTHDLLCSEDYHDKYADYIGSPHLEEWRKKIWAIAIINYRSNLETYRESYIDEELLKLVYESPHFTKFGPLN